MKKGKDFILKVKSPEQQRVWEREEEACANRWRKVSGDNNEKTDVIDCGASSPVVGLETVYLRKRQEAETEVAEIKTLRFSLGVMRMNTSEGQLMLDVLEVNAGKPDRDRSDILGGGSVIELIKRC